ncbi:MAG: hypothetical protein ACLFTT_15315 [Candidatus Hydrogenedentota bacterium]
MPGPGFLVLRIRMSTLPMPPINAKSVVQRVIRWETLAIVLLALVAGGIGAYQMFVRTGLGPDAWPMETFGSRTYEVSVMIAVGKGFCLSDGMPEPLDRFLDQDDRRIERAVAAGFSAGPPPIADQYISRYLYSTVGWLWWIFGISWTVLKAFCIVLGILAAWLAYGVLRLLAGPVISMAGSLVFLLNPIVLAQVPMPRDFAKVPLFLAAFLVWGRLIKYRSSSRRLVVYAVLLGLIAGVGVGFRGDLFLAVPVSIAVIAFAPGAAGRWRLGGRAAATALFLLAYAASSWPIHSTDRATASGPAVYALHGLTPMHQDQLLEPSHYQLAYKRGDHMTLATSTSYATRVLGETGRVGEYTRRSAAAANATLREMAYWFPGDFLARAYASVLRIAGDSGWPQPRHGPMIALSLAAVVALGGVRYRYGFWAAGIAAFLMASMSILFDSRHFTFLAIVPIAVAAFWLARITTVLAWLLPAHYRPTRVRRTDFSWRRLAVSAGAACVAIALCAATLTAVRSLQHARLMQFLDRYDNAEVEPLPVTVHPVDDWVGFYLDGRIAPPVWFEPPEFMPPEKCWERAGLYWPFDAQYAVLRLRPAPHPRVVWFVFDGTPGFSATQCLMVPPSRPGETDPVRYFVPIYEGYGSRTGGQQIFRGVFMPADAADDFLELGRVRNLDDFTILPVMYLPERRSQFQAYRPMRWEPGEEGPGVPVPDSWFRPSADALPKDNAGLPPRGARVVARIGRGALHADDPVARISILKKVLRIHDPWNMEGYTELEKAFGEAGMEEAATAFWLNQVDRFPENFLAWAFLARDYAARLRWMRANEAWEQAIELQPDLAALWAAYGSALVAQDAHAAGVDAWRKAVACAPGYDVYHAGLVVALLAARDYQDAFEEAKRALTLEVGCREWFVGVMTRLREEAERLRDSACSGRPGQPHRFPVSTQAPESKGHSARLHAGAAVGGVVYGVLR